MELNAAGRHKGTLRSPRSSGLVFAVSVALGLSAIHLAQAAHHPVASRAATRAPLRVLSFHLATHFAITSSQGLNGSSLPPERNLEAKVQVAGNKMRIETRSVDQPRVVLYNAPFIYTLLPKSKAGTRYKMSPAQGRNRLDPQTMMKDPATIRATLLKQGARKVGTARLQGVPADVYLSTSFMGKPQNLKAWLRQSDALPLRLEASSRRMKVVVVWSNYVRSMASSSLFDLPQGYTIREAQGPPQSF